MPKIKLGDLMADLGPKASGEGRNYAKIGCAYQDGDRISIKIDTMPIGQWAGWANVFRSDRTHTEGNKRTSPNRVGQYDDDIPF